MRIATKTIFRHLWRNRLFTALNVLGLAVGISACWVVYRIVDYEFSFDKSHPDAEYIYQIVGRFKADGQESGFGGPLPLAPLLSDGISGVDLVVPLYDEYIETLTIPAIRWSRFGMSDQFNKNKGSKGLTV